MLAAAILRCYRSVVGVLEVIAVILGIINVTLVVQRNIWNYPFALVMVAIYARIFFDAKLYSDALLQLFFFAVNIYGWWYWARGNARMGEVRVEIMSTSARVTLAIGLVIVIALWGWTMRTYTDASLPWWDAAIAMMSVAAQILMSRRYLENWALWIAVDVIAVGLYWVKELHLTSALYVVFLALSIWGQEEWMNARKDRRTRAVA